MARNYDRNRIAIVGHAHGAKRLRFADCSGYVGVGARLSIGNCQQRAPAGLLEICAAKVERENKLSALAGEILFHFAYVSLHVSWRILELESLLLCTKIDRKSVV